MTEKYFSFLLECQKGFNHHILNKSSESEIPSSKEFQVFLIKRSLRMHHPIKNTGSDILSDLTVKAPTCYFRKSDPELKLMKEGVKKIRRLNNLVNDERSWVLYP